jgi:hypothetical protein
MKIMAYHDCSNVAWFPFGDVLTNYTSPHLRYRLAFHGGEHVFDVSCRL